jgi:hypothetical protein
MLSLEGNIGVHYAVCSPVMIWTGTKRCLQLVLLSFRCRGTRRMGVICFFLRRSGMSL